MLTLIEVTYTAPLAQVDAVLAEHRAYLKENYDKGLLVVSGPVKKEFDGIKVGGFIMGRMNAEEAQRFIEGDPFHIHGVAQYAVRFLDPVLCSDSFKPVLS